MGRRGQTQGNAGATAENGHRVAGPRKNQALEVQEVLNAVKVALEFRPTPTVSTNVSLTNRLVTMTNGMGREAVERFELAAADCTNPASIPSAAGKDHDLG